MSQAAYALVGMTALVAALVGVLVFAFLRFGSAVRDVRRQLREGNAERAFVATALQDAIRKLRDQEQAMTARAQSSERLNTEIVSSLTSGLLVVGLDGRVWMLNPAGRRLLRVAAPDGGTAYRVLLADAPAVRETIEECLATVKPIVRRSLPLSRPDGGTMHLGITVSPLCEEQGGLLGAICLFTDLTAVVDLEEQLRLKKSLARLGELTAGLAHEFRNGLATIHGYARLLDPSQLSPEFGTYVQGIRDETEALGRVVGNFLSFAKPVQLMLAPVDVGALVRRTAEEIRPDVEAGGGGIAVTGEFATVDGDEVLLHQALANLLRNGLQACQDAAIVPELTVAGAVDRGQNVQRVSIADNGPGIDAGLREKIFQPFFTTRGQGTGLGLAIVQKVIVTHNGRIVAAESKQGGAAFHIALPLSAAS